MSKTTDSRKPGTARATWTGSSAVSLRFTHQVKLSSSFWDRSGRNAFEGGFLGLDNIGVFDRSAPL